MKFPQWPWSTAADPLGAAWIWANLPTPRRKVSLQRQSSRVSEDEREQEKRREDRRRISQQLESGDTAEAVSGILERKRRVNIYLLVAGLISLLSSVLLWTINPYDIIFRMKATLRENGETFEIWKKPPVDLYLKVFLFNVTNKDAFLAGKEKLRLEEVGPYVYKEVVEHTNIVFNGNGTFTSIPRHPLVFVPELTKGQLTDFVEMPNIALMSMASVLEGSSYFTKAGFNLIVRQTNSEPIVKMTAEEFMFGYRDPLVGLGHTLLPSWIHFDKLGLIDRMYDYGDDTVTIYTGETDFRKAGLMERYNGLNHMPQWLSEPCNIVTDTHDGSKYPNFVSRNETLILYRKPFCRGVEQEYVEDAVVDGMQAYHFRFKEGALNNSKEENQCYCKDRCLAPGLIDAESCYYGFPIALSYPHFYQGDPKLVEAVEGIKPIPEEHSSYFYMQVDVGLPLKMAARSQINMALRDMPGIRRVERFRNMVIPLLWTELKMDGLPPSMLMRFYLLLNILPVVQTVGIILLFISGVIIIGVAFFQRKSVNVVSVGDEKEEPEENEEDKVTPEDEEEEKYSSLLMGDAAKTRKGSIQWPRRISIGPSA